MAARRIQQRQVLALLLAVTALAVPLSGAALFGGTAAVGSDNAFLFLGAVSHHDFVPVLMLVGAFGLLVGATEGGRDASSLAVPAAGVVVAAGATLALAHLGTAYHLRPGGAFGMGDGGQEMGWSFVRFATVGSLVVTGVLCGAVVVQVGTWISQRKTGMVR
ncbi:hypothetical protein ACE2AJ_02580 [Aquihabitans daechungensis]|uniref:hypothetical protein n=1 Tax=Aquihabitans daechungensis TaxID=1052257 RepID=UPI003BA10617